MMIDKNVLDNVKELIIHIGLPKTATTSIQETLYCDKNMVFLKESGYFYLRRLGIDHNVTMMSLFHKYALNNPILIEAGVNNETQIHLTNKDAPIKIIDDLAECRAEKVIVSSEALSGLSENEFGKMKAYFGQMFVNAKIKIIICTREYIAREVSYVQQVIINGETIEDQYKRSRITCVSYYQRIFKSLFLYFQKEDIIIYKFEDAVKHKYGPVGFFLSVLGIQNNIISQFDIKKLNESKCFEAVCLFSYINKYVPKYIKNSNTTLLNCDSLDRRTYRFLSSYIKGEKYSFTQEQIDKLYTSSRNDAKWLIENTGINYLESEVKPLNEDKLYSQETIDNLQSIFPFLTIKMKEAFLEFFKKKHTETQHPKFLCLFSDGYFVKNIYNLECRLGGCNYP